MSSNMFGTVRDLHMSLVLMNEVEGMSSQRWEAEVAVQQDVL